MKRIKDAPKRLWRYLVGNKEDPVPALLTWGGMAISLLIAVPIGIAIDAWGFLNNLAAGLALVGPGLLISNIIVRKISNRRIVARVEPQVQHAASLIARATSTALQCGRLLKVSLTVAEIDPRTTPELSQLAQVLTNARDEVARARENPGIAPGPIRLGDEALQFPQFSLICRVIEGINTQHPMPDTLLWAQTAEHWAENFTAIISNHSKDLPQYPGIAERYTGLINIANLTARISLTGWGINSYQEIDGLDYLTCIDRCLNLSVYLAESLAKEIP